MKYCANPNHQKPVPADGRYGTLCAKCIKRHGGGAEWFERIRACREEIARERAEEDARKEREAAREERESKRKTKAMALVVQKVEVNPLVLLDHADTYLIGLFEQGIGNPDALAAASDIINRARRSL